MGCTYGFRLFVCHQENISCAQKRIVEYFEDAFGLVTDVLFAMAILFPDMVLFRERKKIWNPSSALQQIINSRRRVGEKDRDVPRM